MTSGTTHGRSGERGAVGSVQAIVIFPSLILLFLALVEVALFAYGRTTAIEAAQAGAAAAAAEGGTVASCQQAAADLLARAGDALTGAQITCRTSGTRASASVTAQVLSVFPWQPSLTQFAVAPKERIT